MTILKRTLLSFLACAGLALSAQLVEKTSPESKAKSKVGKTASSTTGQEKKASVKGLDAFGITPRALATWKRSGAREDLAFKVVVFQRRDASDHGYPVFEMHGREVFDRSDLAPVLALVRLRPDGPEMSLNSGSTWVKGEESQKTWAFAFDNQLITLAQLDEAFKPTSFKSMAFERGVIVQRKKEILDDYRVNPFFHSVVIALAFGQNEVEGILKYPGASFVVPFKGVRFKDRWIARSLTSAPFNTSVYPPSGTGMNGTDMGAKALRSDDNKFTQIEVNDQRLLLGTGGFLNYAVEGEPAERLETASEFELAKAHNLPTLSEAFHANFGRSLWTKTDEIESFSRTAEKAYVKAGLKAWFWAPYQSKWPNGVGGDNAKKARESLDPMLRRIQSLGGEFGLLDYTGNPPLGGLAPSSPSRSKIGQSQPESAGTAIPKFPLEALTSSDHLISVHTPNEIRFWSSDMKRTLSRQAMTPSELLTSAAISPDGRAFVTAGFLGVRMWNADLGQSTSILPMDGCTGYWCATFSADGSMVAGGGKDGHARIWDTKSGRLLGNTKGGDWGISFAMNAKKAHERMKNEYIASVAFSQDGKRFAEGAANGDLKIWDIADPTKPKKIKALELDDLEKIWRMKFLREGQELLVLNQTGSYRILDTATWKVVRKADNTLPPATSILYPQGDGSIITSHVGGKVVRTSLVTGGIERDMTVEGSTLGVLAERGGKMYLLDDEAWKPIGF